MMKKTLVVAVLILLVTTLGFAQQPTKPAESKADVQMEKHSDGALHPGDSISFTVKLNAPLPKGAYFSFRISPVSADQEISLNSGEPLDESRTKFRVSGSLPAEAYPGKWHVAVIWLFLPGTSWTHNSIMPNGVTFDVEGKQFMLPATAEVSLDSSKPR